MHRFQMIYVVPFIVGLCVFSVTAQAQILTRDSGAVQMLSTNAQAGPSLPQKVVAEIPVREESASNKQPIEITADESLEWRRNEQIFVARKNALARQGSVSIAAQVLAAQYRNSEKSGIEIHTITADQNVVVSSDNNTAYGDRAVYDIDKAMAAMTGNNLRMHGPDQTITADGSFQYWVTKGRIDAIKNVKIIRGEDTLRADKMSATLKNNARGERILDTMEGHGNVVIETPDETLTGAYGIYNAKTDRAKISGGVTITRGQNILQGDSAEVDLTTNISRMFANPSKNKRVRGIFYPDSQ